MDSLKSNLVSVLFQNVISAELSHTILDESETVFQQLMGGSFKVSRIGADVFLEITSESEFLYLRQISRIPLFMKFR